jgi:hypothetical protein
MPGDVGQGRTGNLNNYDPTTLAFSAGFRVME